MRSNKPYVGVTAPFLPDEVRGLEESFSAHGFSLDGDYWPMIGFLANRRTLTGESQPGLRYLHGSSVQEMVSAASGTFVTLHYYTKDAGSLAAQVHDLFEDLEFGGPYGVQLNVQWPRRRELERIKRFDPEMKVILQASDLRSGVDEFLESFSRYGPDVVDYVLLDESRGNGDPFSVERVLPYYHALRDEYRVVVAGGLDPDNVEQKIAGMRGGGAGVFGVDVETGVRDVELADMFSPSKADSFIRRSGRIRE